VLLNPTILVVSGLSDVLGAIERILLSYLVHMHSRPRSLRQGQVHVGPITWEVLPHSASPDPRARTQPRLRKTVSASPDPRARTPPRPRKTVSASPDPRARTQPRLRKTVSASPDPRARTQPRPRRSHRLARPRARTDHVTGGAIITLPLASSGYGEQDRRPIWLAPVKQVMMAPRVLNDDGGSQPLTEARRRQQGSDSPDSCASTGLKRSSDDHDIT
jgi:hypothetical protein